MRKFREKIMRKFREKVKRKFREKNGNYAKKRKNFVKNTQPHSFGCTYVLWTDTDRNLKRLLEKSNSLHQTFIKVKEEKLLI